MKLRTPLTIVNFKTYKEATGKNAERLAKALAAVAKQEKRELVVAVQAADIYRVAKYSGAKVFAQHVDVGYGKFTGSVTAEAVRQSGATGTLINHSEKRLGFAAVKEAVAAAKSAGLVAVVCADTPEKAAKVAELKPDFVAIEVPALIATANSISEGKPEAITATVRKVKVPVLCGAGINKKEDVKTAQELGTKGILVSNAVVNAKNPANALKKILSGYE